MHVIDRWINLTACQPIWAMIGRNELCYNSVRKCVNQYITIWISDSVTVGYIFVYCRFISLFAKIQ